MSSANWVQVLPGALTADDETAAVPVGSLATVAGSIYRYVKFDNGTAVAAVANAVCYWKDRAAWTVGSDFTDCGSFLNGVCGVFQVALTDAYYGWVLISGRVALLKADGGDDIVEGDYVIASSTDGVVNRMAADTAATNRIIGMAIEADATSGTTVDTEVRMFN